MAKLRGCPFCGGKHRKKTAAKKCMNRKLGGKAWTKKELGY